jgi:hypothetical protein
MSLLDVTRELHRTRAEHVRVVLLDFFGGNPPPAEVTDIVTMTEELARAFRAVAANESPAPEEPKQE